MLRRETDGALLEMTGDAGPARPDWGTVADAVDRPALANCSGRCARMAKDDHIAQFMKAGVTSWNAWRDENPNILHPALCRVDLSGATLPYTNLSGADLS